MNRCVFEFDCYGWPKDDEEAMKLAKEIEKLVNDKYDNSTSVNKIVEQPSGTIGNRLIFKK